MQRIGRVSKRKRKAPDLVMQSQNVGSFICNRKRAYENKAKKVDHAPW